MTQPKKIVIDMRHVGKHEFALLAHTLVRVLESVTSKGRKLLVKKSAPRPVESN